MEILEFTRRLHDRCVELTDDVKFDKHDINDVTMIAQYGSLIELTGAIVKLIDAKMGSAVPTVFRTFLETYVDSVILLNNPNYIESMKLAMQKQWGFVLKAAKDGNPFLVGIAKAFDLDEQIALTKQQIEDAKDQGGKNYSFHDKFKEAGLTEEYPSIYNRLCTDSHSNLSALISRHFDIKEDDHHIVFYKDRPLEDYLPTLDTICGILIHTTENLHTHFNSGKAAEIEPFKTELQEIRSRYKL